MSPHVCISPGVTKTKAGDALGEAELLVVLDAGVAVVEVLSALMVDGKERATNLLDRGNRN